MVYKILSSVPVKGNGIVLGLTNGTATAGLGWVNQGYLSATTGSYGTAPKTASVSPFITGQFGVTTDKTKSGLIADTSSISIKTLKLGKYYIKYQ